MDINVTNSGERPDRRQPFRLDRKKKSGGGVKGMGTKKLRH